MLKKIFILSFLITVFAISSVAYLLSKPIVATNNKGNSSESILVEIEKGQTLSELAYTWENKGWIPSAKLLLVQARIMGGAKSIKPGEFEIPSDTKVYELLPLLINSDNKRYKVSFIEGTRLTDALIRLKNAPKLKQDVQPLTVESVKALLKINNVPEGWVYPDTYVYHSGDSVSSVLHQSHQRMQTVLGEEWQQYLDKLSAGKTKKLPYSNAYDVLIMASIVEKETGQESERPEIAGVFIRRLEKDMRLETDPTVIYGLGESYSGNLRRKHLLDRSNTYNTYRNKGLPPTPIALAGRDAINASLNPKDGNSIFFVAKGDGSHYFSSTLAEHNRAVRQYQILNRKKNYRSAPAAN
mgnify:CR=1 FL=1